jgi:hypothetical protein
VLGPSAWAAHKTATFLGRTFHRLKALLGGKKAAMAVAQENTGDFLSSSCKGDLVRRRRDGWPPGNGALTFQEQDMAEAKVFQA